MPQLCPFNGATAIRPWKRRGPGVTRRSRSYLQWSHGHSTVETIDAIIRHASAHALQWSHGHSTVETTSQEEELGMDILLQWSHGHSTVKTTSQEEELGMDILLQWSHGHSTVKTHRRARGRPDLRLPSMGPRPFDRGNFGNLELDGGLVVPSMEPRPFDRGNRGSPFNEPMSLASFNGATAIRPWKRRALDRSCRPSSPFNGATAIRPWKHRTAPPFIKNWIAFNGATAIRPWKRGHRNLAAHGGYRPSMEPRPFDRGNQTRSAWDRTTMSNLQWSHGHSTVETCGRLACGNAGHPASMEPRPFDRGNPLSNPQWHAKQLSSFNGATAFRPWKPAVRWATKGSQAGSSRFNGATAFRPWKHVAHQLGRVGIVSASMEPRPFDRGNLEVFTVANGINGGASMEPRPFDRGNSPGPVADHLHDSASMEPRPFDRGNFGNFAGGIEGGIASMEPRPFDRGNTSRTRRLVLLLNASMEPRPFDRGNAAAVAVLVESATALQWSHGLSTVETAIGGLNPH